MKLKNFCGMCAALLVLTACTQEKFDYQAPNFTSAELTEGKAYTVTVNTETNLVTLTSLLGDSYITSWVTPQGMAKGTSYSFSLPFSGTYEITFGVDTRGGLVYADPYTFSLPNNNFSLLSDEIWTNLAGGVDENGNGSPKTWVPVNANYGIGRCSSPLMYLSPDDIMNDGSNQTDLKIGSDNWTPNWDPGFQSWLIDSDDPYLDSEMTLYLDSQKGSVAEIKKVSKDGTQEYTTTFNLNISDPQRPLLSFNSGEMLHAAWGDGVCSNYSTDLKILECTPYLLQIATMRTNSEGPWWLVWNFIAKEVKDDPSILPSEGPELVDVASPQLPVYNDLATTLFTIEGDATYYASETTLIMNDEIPYDVMYWNGANGGSWEWINGYGSSWEPAYPAADEFALVLSRKNDGTYSASLESAEGSQTSLFTIGENTITFEEKMLFLSAGNQTIEGKEFTVLKCSPADEQVVLGIPDGTDNNGKVNRYLCVNLNIKPIGGGQEGPKEIAGNNDNLGVYIEASDHLRLELYNPWGSNNWFTDLSKMKLKKGETATINFKVNGITWKEGAQPRVLFANNIDALGFEWPSKGAGFDQPHTILNTSTGEGTVSLTNSTDAAVTFEGSSCVTICIEIADLVESPSPLFDESGNLDPSVTGEIISLTIQ